MCRINRARRSSDEDVKFFDFFYRYLCAFCLQLNVLTVFMLEVWREGTPFFWWGMSTVMIITDYELRY